MALTESYPNIRKRGKEEGRVQDLFSCSSNHFPEKAQIVISETETYKLLRKRLNETMLVPFCAITLSFLATSSHAFTASTSVGIRQQLRTGSDLSMSTESTGLTLNPEETAFVFIEYQNEFATEGGKLYDAVKDVMEKTNMLENSAALMNVARDSGCTIIHAPISFEPGHDEIADTAYGILAGVKEGSAFTQGEWGADFSASMMPQKGDLIVKGKSGLCSFASTNLDFLLRQKGAKNVVLGGFLTNCCVESTMRTAYELNYNVYTLSDCVAATSLEAQDATLEHNFGMFSIQTTSKEITDAISSAVTN